MHCGVHKHAQKSGWLHKRGGRIQTWHKRWFVLTGDMLFYYKSNQDSRPTGTIALAGNNVIRHQDDSRQPNWFKFEIVAGSGRSFVTSTHDSYLISAESSDEANSWVAAIKRALHEPFGGGMFGRSLEETMQVEARLGGSYVPVLMHRCAKFILDHGADEIGVFRLPGQTSRVQALKDQYDQGSQKEIPSAEDVHTVASLLKLYLRELPEPIIPYFLFDDASKAVKVLDNDQEQGIEEVRKILNRLPQVNYNVLKYTCRFLHMVSLHSDKNKMNSVNLGTVFGPNLMTPKSFNPQTLIELSNVSANFVSYLIRLQDKLFPVTNDEKPPKRLSIVAPMDLNGWQETLKGGTNKQGGSLFLKGKGDHSDSIKREARSRLGSVPTRLLSSSPVPIEMDKPIKIKPHKLLQRLDSPRRSRKNIFSAHESNSPMFMECGSGRISPIMTASPTFPPEDDDEDDERENQRIINSEESSSPEIPNHLSSVPGFCRNSDTFPPEVVVNSIAKEMESMEKELKVVKAALTKRKKEARLWKMRYEQERRARVAAEDQIKILQKLVDDTFQQFALDDSEDDFFDEDNFSSPSEEGSLEDGPLLSITQNGGLEDSQSLNMPVHLEPTVQPSKLARHIRAQSSQ